MTCFIFVLGANVCFIKNRTKHSSNTLLKLVRIFIKQTLSSHFEWVVSHVTLFLIQLHTFLERPFSGSSLRGTFANGPSTSVLSLIMFVWSKV